MLNVDNRTDQSERPRLAGTPDIRLGRPRAETPGAGFASLDLRNVQLKGDVMNEDTLKCQWTQLKGKVREQWGKLTDDDVNMIEGQSQQLVGRIQERYGIARDEAKRQVDDWLRKDRERTAIPSSRP
jgi:uncharacterized protein YjbJ (UPF0337 family)